MSDMRGISGKALAHEANFYGAPLFVLRYNSSTSTGTTNTDTIFSGNWPFALKILRAQFTLTEAAAADSEDVKLTDGTNNITDTADYSAGSDNDSFEFSSYNDLYTTLQKGATLKIVKTATTAVTSFDMHIYCVKA